MSELLLTPTHVEGFILFIAISISVIGVATLLHNLILFIIREVKIAFNLRTSIRAVIKENVTNYVLDVREYRNYIHGLTDIRITIKNDVTVTGRMRVTGAVLGDTVTIINNGTIDLTAEPTANRINTSKTHSYS